MPPDTVLLDVPAHAGELLLDVRTAAEFAQSHVRGSVNLPLSVILAGDDLQLPTDRTILVICRSGARAEVAAAALRARGFVEVRALTGGLLALGA